MTKLALFPALLLVFLLSNELAAKSWTQAIEDVEARAESIWDRGVELGAPTFLGTAVNELDIPRHRCAILGRMLGHTSAVLQLEQNEEPQLSANPSADELYDLMLFSHSLSNWAFIARALQASSIDQRKHEWNLNCVGQMGISGSLFESIAEPRASFEVSGSDLRVLGDVEQGFFDQFSQYISDNPEVRRVVLGSGGGSISEALKAGLLIRRHGLETTLSDNCYSACTLVFLGGVKRTIWSPYPTLGFHKVSKGDGKAIPNTSPVYDLIYRYSVEMGVDPEFVLTSMWKAEPIGMYEPELIDLCKHWVTTWVQRACDGGDDW